MDRRTALVFIAIFGIVFSIGVIQHESASSESSAEISDVASTSARYIVQAESLEIAKKAVETVGAEHTQVR